MSGLTGRWTEKGRKGGGGRKTNLQPVFPIQVCHPDEAFAVASSFKSRSMREGIVFSQEYCRKRGDSIIRGVFSYQNQLRDTRLLLRER